MSVWINDADVRAQLESVGLLIEGPLELARADGRSRRCKVSGMDSEKRGWYRLSEWMTDEGVMLVGTYGVFEGDNSNTNKIDLSKRCESCGHEMPLKAKACPSCGSKAFKSRELTAEQKAAFKAKQAADKKRADAERRAETERAARWAGAVWFASKECTPADHDYFGRKHIDRTCGARIYPGNEGVMLDGSEKEDYQYLGQFAGALVIPMCNADGKVFGVQFILSREKHQAIISRTGRDKEFWPAGMSLEGKFFMVGGIPSDIAMITEGYATGVSMHMATGMPVGIAFTAGNLGPVTTTLRKHYKRARFLIGADDDWIQKCAECKQYTPVATPVCAHCGKPHKKMNAGVTRANEAVLAVSGTAFIKPVFSVDRPSDRKGPTDFNDLHCLESLNTVRSQIEAGIAAAEWVPRAPVSAGGGSLIEGGGESLAMAPRLTIDEAAARFWCTYGLGGKALFDEAERRLVAKDDVLNLLPEHGWAELKKHPGWRVARDHEIGFDPTERDGTVKCNMFGGWPTTPREGSCQMLLGLLFYLCSKDPNAREIYHWILCWLAYPLQHRGAKMHSAILVHGPQGTGKSRFFEAVADIYGQYGRVLGQDALEDKFNADWAEKKLFIVGDEVMAKVEMYHVKNRLKGFITGSTIRVNPKNVAAHTEKNQMNIVFLSNERQPMILENDDRRHLVLWTPPKPDEDFFAQVNEEIDNGGIAALHHYLLNLDLGDFKPWTKPPMTQAKQDLIELGLSSEERFLLEWQRLEIEGKDGEPVPFCPCLGSHLYRVYEDWCKRQGEFRPRPSNHFMNFFAKQGGWAAGKSDATWVNLKDKTVKNRKMVIPGETAMLDAIKRAPPSSGQHRLARELCGSKAEWLTVCFFAFEAAIGGQS